MVYDHPEVLNENMLVTRMFEIVVALIAEEIKFMLMWRSTYPYRCAALLEASPFEVALELGAMKNNLASWGVVTTKHSLSGRLQ